jgi:hypothetical protein
MELVLERSSAERTLDFALARGRLLPPVESDDAVDVVDDSLDDDRRLVVLDGLEQLSERGFARSVSSAEGCLAPEPAGLLRALLTGRVLIRRPYAAAVPVVCGEPDLVVNEPFRRPWDRAGRQPHLAVPLSRLV